MAFSSTLTYGRSLPAEICLMLCEMLDKHTLSSLTVLCKAWRDLANGPLWRTLPSLTPLLKLFPEDSRARTRFFSDDVKFIRTLTAQDWDLVLTRSCLVKAIDANMVPEIRFSQRRYNDSVAEALSACPLPSTFLPRLNWLVLPYDAFAPTNKSEAAYLTLLSPQIRTFGISNRFLSGKNTEWDISSLDKIVRACPKVSRLSFGVLVPEQALCPALGSWTCLNAVQVKVPEHSDCGRILEALYNLPALRSVALYLYNVKQAVEMPSASNESPPLEALTLTAATSSLCCAIMQYFGIRHMKSLRLWCMGVEHLGPEHTDEALFEEIQQVMQYIGSNGSANLSHVEVELDNQETELAFELLSTLAPLSGMEHLTLSGGASDINDADCETFARWWPSLRIFHLKASRRFDECVGCTLDALLPFAEHCPDLQSLTLPINATKSPPLIRQPLENSSLTCLDVLHGAEIMNHRQVALFLYELFPNLEEIRLSKEESDDEEKAETSWQEKDWYAVQEAINVMRDKDEGVTYLV
ncbi:uncharacterized protein SCHCODRAFT_02590127 [Schizophyllum commune H4-8]|nr:uncharacterized protein SCHCODRAFT_02590127 [Schizophyllum commune H4-8]KAI5886808.1 hypothetical protein SCHCODRAFT_02590127 [Schizophyllum commune H4-8]